MAITVLLQLHYKLKELRYIEEENNDDKKMTSQVHHEDDPPCKHEYLIYGKRINDQKVIKVLKFQSFKVLKFQSFKDLKF